MQTIEKQTGHTVIIIKHVLGVLSECVRFQYLIGDAYKMLFYSYNKYRSKIKGKDERMYRIIIVMYKILQLHVGREHLP
jgi:hypothetical protein